jgi:hypothetical protein
MLKKTHEKMVDDKLKLEQKTLGKKPKVEAGPAVEDLKKKLLVLRA